MTPFTALLPLLALLSFASAATKNDWRSRSIYQVITDRFAPAADTAPCNTADRVYCGGTWQTLVAKLDYIQGMGFDAVWISPTALNVQGSTPDGYAYHGYWTVDPTQLNPQFGSSDDLKALSAALHSRGMYLMVDIAINGLATRSSDASAASLAASNNDHLLFKDASDYHPKCDVDWGNHTSEMDCWLSTYGVSLMDLDQTNTNVVQTLINWVPGFVHEFSIDGFRLDASKHMPISFQHDFCTAAGIFCIGEVYGDDTGYASTFQGANGIDSVFAFGMQAGLTRVFTKGEGIDTLKHYLGQGVQHYSDPTVIGSFMDNHDLPRFNSLTSDKSLSYNALTFTILNGGIPTVYYGTEQDISDGKGDPSNREALWLYNDFSTTASPSYARIASLNKIRSTLAKNPAFVNSVVTAVTEQANDTALARGGALIVLTNRGGSGTGSWKIANSTFSASTTVIDLLSCATSSVGSDESLTVNWTTGQPFVFVSSDVAAAGGFCGAVSNATSSSISASTTSTSTSASTSITSSASTTSSVSTTTLGADLVPSTANSSSSIASTASSDSSSPTNTSIAIADPMPTGNSSDTHTDPRATVVQTGTVFTISDIHGVTGTPSPTGTSSSSSCNKRSRRRLARLSVLAAGVAGFHL